MIQTNKIDAGFVRDVWMYHLTPVEQGGTGYFHDFDQIFIASDSGPCFLNWNIMWFYSSVFELFGKFVELAFYCKLHAYNICDSKGASAHRLLDTEMLAGNACLTAEDIAKLLNLVHIFGPVG